jgi:hypothetical protein
VRLDGLALGVTPMRIDVMAGEHSVVIEHGRESLTEQVTVKPGATASLLVPLGAAPPTHGWVTVTAPVEVLVYEGGQLLGSSQSARIMVPAGTRELEIVSEVLNYRTTRTVHVAPGGTARIQVPFPTGSVAVNAIPWADVWIDGARVGTTPLGSLAVPIGPHEVVFRHPDLGERRYAISVTLGSTVRLGVDFTRE